MSLTQVNKAGLDEIALDHVFTIGASGTSAYTFQGEGLNGTVNNPTLYLTRGKTYRFENGTGGHPIRIQSTSGASGTQYNTGVTNNASAGTVIVEVQHDAPDVLYYQCTSHPAMNGILYITGALADGGVTTAKLADDAVTDAKLANSVVASISANTAKTSNATHTGDVTGSTSLTIASSAVTTAKIADQAVTLAKLPHGDGSSDGKFLRANNGADPTFETVTSTTINNNANNRVITGSDTANTLEAESNIVVDAGGRLGVGTSTPVTGCKLTVAGNGLAITGQNIAHGANSLRIGEEGSGVAQLRAYGPDASTNGSIQFTSSRSDGSNSKNVNIADNGQLLVGTDTKSSYSNRQLCVGDVSNASSFLEIRTSSSGTSHLLFSRSSAADSGNYRGYIAYNQPSDFMGFYTGGGHQRARIDADGLKFGSDTASANGLSDYEEGTFSAHGYDSSGNQFSTSLTGKYTKIGNRVHISIFFFAYGGSANKTMGSFRNLPFTGVSEPHATGVICRTSGGNHVNIEHEESCYLSQGGTQIRMKNNYGTGSSKNNVLSLTYMTTA